MSHPLYRLTQIGVLIAVMCCPVVYAADFTITAGTIVTSTQTLEGRETGIIEEGGRIETSLAAVAATGSNNIITNSGDVSTSGTSAYSICSESDSVLITNNGTISSTGNSSPGIFSGAAVTSAGIEAVDFFNTDYDDDQTITLDINYNKNTIINNGVITTEGSRSTGIYSTGYNSIIANSGTISTTGRFGYGIVSFGEGDAITNSGVILTTGTYADGIASGIGGNDTITNSGMITTTGVSAYGIGLYANNITVINGGTITTTGTGGHGIYSDHSGATITHNGSITVNGDGAIGINSDTAASETTTLNIRGKVIAAGDATQAIAGGEGAETLNLYAGVSVIGTINLGAGNDLTEIISSGAGSSSTIDLTYAGTINYTSGNALSFYDADAATPVIHFVDTTNLTATQASLGSASSLIFKAVNKQLNKTPALNQPVKVAATRLTASMLPDNTGPVGWGTMFGQHTERGTNGAALAFTDNTFGMVGGYEQTMGQYRAGIFGGVSHSNIDTDMASSKTDNNSFFVGLYGQYAEDDWVINGALATGYVSYDSERLVTDNLAGVEVAQADYDGIYISPSVSVMRIFDRGTGFSWRPSAELNYTYARLDSYEETGTTSANLNVGSRNASVLNTRLQLAAHQELANNEGEVEIRGGISHSTYGSDDIDISMDGFGSTNYAMTGTDNITGAYISAGICQHVNKNLNVIADIEYNHGSDDDRAFSGYVGIEYLF